MPSQFSPRTPKLALACASAALVGSVIFASPAYASSPTNSTDPGPAKYDRTDPVKTHCADTAMVVKEEKIIGRGGAEVGTLRLMYSRACETNWIAVYNTVPGTMVNKTISRGKRMDTNGNVLDDGGGSPEADPVTGWSYSKQVWAAGDTCVDYSVWIKKRGIGSNDWPGTLSGHAC